MFDRPEIAVLIVAGGRGSRVGGVPKQYRKLAGEPIIARTVRAFATALPDAAIQTVIAAGDEMSYRDAVSGLTGGHGLPAVIGGATRQESVRAGLEALARLRPAHVLIHDAARPFVTPEVIAAARKAAAIHGAAVPGVPVTDTVKVIDANGAVRETPDRAGLRAIQTPQAFRFDLILEAHRAQAGAQLTDDGAVAEAAGHTVHVFEGDAQNVKITTTDDLATAEARFSSGLTDVRIGQGYDVHALGPGGVVWFGGVAIPHDQALVGHSDADVVAHAVTDAILGALADGDIGSHFPPSDPQWKGAASSIFLAHAAKLVRERGGQIAHVDATVVCERPKVGPHRDAIRASLANIMGIDVGRVAVKATTSERLGFPGREEGVVAMATATVRLPGAASA